MGIIIPHQSNQGIATANAGQAANYQSASTFTPQKDIDSFNGLQSLAMGMQNVNNAVHQENVKRKQEQNEIDVLKDMQDFQEKASAWKDTYMQSYKGVDARNAEQDTQKFLTETINPLLEKWKDTPSALKYIQLNFGQYASAFQRSMRHHSIEQEQQYAGEVLGKEKATTGAILSDPSSTYEDRDKAWNSYAYKRMAHGTNQQESPEAIQQDLNTLLRNSHFNRLLSQAEIDPKEIMRLAEQKPASAYLPKEVARMSKNIAKENAINPELIASIISTESSGNTSARSKKGASGLMQLMPETQKELEEKYSIDGNTPEGNVRLGTLYEKELLKKYDGDEHLALMAYNWGMGNVDSFLATGHGIKTASNPSGNIPLETKKYVSKILGVDDANTWNALSPEQKIQVKITAENLYAEHMAESLYHDVHEQNISESEAQKTIRAIENPKVRRAAQQGFATRLQGDKIQEREEIENAQIAAYDDVSKITESDTPDAEIFRELNVLMREAKKKAITGTKADKAYLKAMEKSYAKILSPLWIPKKTDPLAFMQATNAIAYGDITTEKELKRDFPEIHPKDMKRLTSCLGSSQKIHLAEVNRQIALFEGNTPPFTDDKKIQQFHTIIIQNVIDAAKQVERINDPEWIKKQVALYYMQGIDKGFFHDEKTTRASTLLSNASFYPTVTDQEKAEIEAEFLENPSLRSTYEIKHGRNYAVQARYLDKRKEDANKNEPNRPFGVDIDARWDSKRLGWFTTNPTSGKTFFLPLIRD